MSVDSCKEEEADSSFECPERLEGDSVSAVEACEKIKRMTAEMDKEIELAKNEQDYYENQSMGILAGFNRWIENQGTAEAESDQTVVNNIKATLDSIQISDQYTKCLNDGAYIIQNNTLTVTEDCARLLIENGYPLPVVAGNVQKLESDFTQKCQINAIASALTQAKPSLENEAMQSALNKATGGTVSSDSLACTNIDASTTACSYLKQRTCCKNEATVTQENVINACAMNIIDNVQESKSSVMQNCMIGVHNEQEATNAADVTNTTTQEATNTSDTTNYGLIVIVIAIVLILLILILL